MGTIDVMLADGEIVSVRQDGVIEGNNPMIPIWNLRVQKQLYSPDWWRTAIALLLGMGGQLIAAGENADPLGAQDSPFDPHLIY